MSQKTNRETSESDLQRQRQAIDDIDAQLVELLNQRAMHVMVIGEIKQRTGGSIYVPHREQSVLDKITKLNAGPLPPRSLNAIYREIMSGSINLEQSMSIAFLGPEATFTHQAALKKFGHSLSYFAQNTISEVFNEVSKGCSEYGVVPVENSTEGVVSNTLDMFMESDLKMVSQIVMNISHCLVSNTELSQVRKLYTHPQALGQCRKWIQNNLPQAEIIETSSTTRAAELAAGQTDSAAIASGLAAKYYHLHILESDIQDISANATRFLVLSEESRCGHSTGKDRTSLMFRITDEVGALYSALAPFLQHRINMTKIESRPSKLKAWEYYFFIDVDGHIEDPALKVALNELKAVCGNVKWLGSYPRNDRID